MKIQYSASITSGIRVSCETIEHCALAIDTKYCMSALWLRSTVCHHRASRLAICFAWNLCFRLVYQCCLWKKRGFINLLLSDFFFKTHLPGHMTPEINKAWGPGTLSYSTNTQSFKVLVSEPVYYLRRRRIHFTKRKRYKELQRTRHGSFVVIRCLCTSFEAY